MDINSFRKVIKQREETDDEWDYGIEQCCKKEIEILTRNIDETIYFLRNECTYDEFEWITEVTDEIDEILQSEAFLKCIHEINEKFVNQGYQDNGYVVFGADYTPNKQIAFEKDEQGYLIPKFIDKPKSD